MKNMCSSCPECGSEKYVNKNLVRDGFIECRKCGQECWNDIDYKNHFNKNTFNSLENTRENKSKLFAQYWGQKVLFDEDIMLIVHDNNIFRSNRNNSHLLLKKISTINDDDYSFIFDKKYTIVPAKSIQKNYIFYGHLNQEQIDYLRSKGYALPYIGLSVEKQIEYGWIKLI